MAFPQATTVIDNFNRADGALNAGGGSTIWNSVAYGGGTAGLAVISNTMGATTTSGAQLSLFTSSAGFDAVIDIAVAAGVNTSYFAWFFCMQSGTTGSWSAYWALITDQWKINKRIAGSTTNLTSPSGPVLATGDKVGIHRVDDIIELHHYTSGAWNPTPIASVTGETSIATGGTMAFDLQTTNWRLDNLLMDTVTGGGGGGGGSATTLYVDADHVAASDSWTRAQVDATHPLKTITHAAALAQASATFADTIAVKPAVNADPTNLLDTHVYKGFVHGGGEGLLPFGTNTGNLPIVVKGVKADGTQPANDSQRPRWIGFHATQLANWHFQDLHFGYEFNSGKDVLTSQALDRPNNLVFDRCMWTGGAYQITNAGNIASAAGLMQWNDCEITARISTFHGTGGRRLDGVGFRIINSAAEGEDYRVHFEWNRCEMHHVMGEDAFQIGTGSATQLDTYCHWTDCVWHDISQLPDDQNPADVHTDSAQLLGGPEYKFVRCEWYRVTDAIIASDFHHGLIHLENCLIKGAAIDDIDPVLDFDRGQIVINAGIGLQVQGTDNLVLIHNTVVQNGFGLGLLNYFKQPGVVTKRVMLNNIFESVSNAGVVLDVASEDRGNLVGAANGDYSIPGTDVQGFTEFGTSATTIMEITTTPASPARNIGVTDIRVPALDRVGRTRPLGPAPDAGCHETPLSPAVTPDARPPIVIELSPPAGAGSVDPGASVGATLYPQPGHTINAASVTTAHVYVADPSGTHLPVTSLTLSGVDVNGYQTITLNPATTLYPFVTYTATLTGIADDVGNVLATRTWQFTVLGAAPQTELAPTTNGSSTSTVVLDWPPLPNATLTMVQAAGTPADYDRTGAVGAVKWQGEAIAVWLEYEDRVEGDEANVLIHRELVVAEALGVDWQQTDTVTVLRGNGTISGTIRRIKTTQASNNGGVPGTVRLVLDDA